MSLKLLDAPAFLAKLDIQLSSWKFLIFKTLCGSNKTYPWAIYNLQVIVCCSDLNLAYQLEFLLLHQVFLFAPSQRGCSDQKAWLGLENNASKLTQITTGWRSLNFFHPLGLSIGECTHTVASGISQSK